MTVTIEPRPDGPYLVKGLETLTGSGEEALETKDVIALCRCGGSANKPFCDGTHKTNGFTSENASDRSKDRRVDYAGAEITVHDNRAICAHCGACTKGLPAVWDTKRTPWIDPDGAPAGEIAEVVRQCPSGALSHSLGGVEHRDHERPPAILVSRNGPYYVTGGIELEVDDALWGEGASREHFTLCRCGHSKNKPFCDGTHWSVGFTDEGS